MPMAAARWCARCRAAEVGPCPQAVADRKTRAGAYDEQRGTPKQRGYGEPHKRWRKAVLRRDPFCMDCLEDRRITLATEAHHVMALRKGGEPFALDNGRGLCRSCHAKRTARGE